jgi:gamma-glutamyltranspeptidase/glutathione hydrolase
MSPTTRLPEGRGQRGMVATPHALASEAALAILRRGGNAIDAAVAAAATIAVVHPHMNGVGGDNFWLLWLAPERRLIGLNASGRSALAAELATYRARWGRQMPTRGGAAALTVPGAVSGWWQAHTMSRDSLGSPLAWPALLEAAIAHAHEGVAVSSSQRRVTEAAASLFAPDAPAEVRHTFWPAYHPERLRAGHLAQPRLADTLRLIAGGGADEFYRGALGRRLAEGARAAGSPLAGEDFAAHQADWVEPLRIPYRGGEAASLPPPTQGFAALAILGLLDGFDVGSLDEADYVHVVVEATKLAFADRDRYLADPSIVPVPVERCLDPGYLAARRRLISRRTALAIEGLAGAGDTVSIVTADGQGNAAVVIQSLYWEYGAAVIAGDTGVVLQNRGAFFSLDASHPNCLAPRKRPAHTLIPSMYLLRGRPHLLSGTMGGEGQPQTQAALVTRLVDRGLGPQAAVEAPRWLLGRTWGETSRALRLESRFGDDVVESLRGRGHDVRTVEAWSDLMGHAQVIRLADGWLTGGSDPRADGVALGE